jgi:spermidine synthase
MTGTAGLGEPSRAYVREELGTRSLHFSMAQTQSVMQLQRPDVLELEYTCLMMGFLMVRPDARRLAMIGLGGGSIAKFCHRHLPRASMRVVELNPTVIALREVFHVPPDGERFSVVQADGARFVAETTERYDVLMVDAFDAQGMPAALGTRRFYGDCLDVLAPGGVMVVNLHAAHPLAQVYVERLRASVGARVVRVVDSDGGNCVVFGVKSGRAWGWHTALARRPARLDRSAWSQLQGAFARIAAAALAQAHEPDAAG